MFTRAHSTHCGLLHALGGRHRNRPEETNMDTTKKAVVEPPKSATPPVQAKPEAKPEPKAMHRAASENGSQPKAKT